MGEDQFTAYRHRADLCPLRGNAPTHKTRQPVREAPLPKQPAAAAGERRVEYMPLPLIDAAPRNPKRHATTAIRSSISRFGVGELPLLDERTGRLVAGHGRLDDLAARHRAGEDPPDGVHVGADGSWLVPVVRGWASRSDAEAEAYLVASNQLTIMGGWNDNDLIELLVDLRDNDPDLLELTGFDEAFIDKHFDVAADTADALADTEDKYKEQYGVIVVCDTEDDQQRAYEALRADGYNCRVVTT